MTKEKKLNLKVFENSSSSTFYLRRFGEFLKVKGLYMRVTYNRKTSNIPSITFSDLPYWPWSEIQFENSQSLIKIIQYNDLRIVTNFKRLVESKGAEFATVDISDYKKTNTVYSTTYRVDLFDSLHNIFHENLKEKLKNRAFPEFRTLIWSFNNPLTIVLRLVLKLNKTKFSQFVEGSSETLLFLTFLEYYSIIKKEKLTVVDLIMGDVESRLIEFLETQKTYSPENSQIIKDEGVVVHYRSPDGFFEDPIVKHLNKHNIELNQTSILKQLTFFNKLLS